MLLASATVGVLSVGQTYADDVKIGVVVSETATYAFVGVPLVNGMK